jgi:GxxExxY protein
MKVNDVTGAIIGVALEVHRTLGPGLLESAYEERLGEELKLCGIPFDRQRPSLVNYKGRQLDCGYRKENLCALCASAANAKS